MTLVLACLLAALTLFTLITSVACLEVIYLGTRRHRNRSLHEWFLIMLGSAVVQIIIILVITTLDLTG